MRKKPVMLLILDGWGLGEAYEGNAIYRAKTPNFDSLISQWPNSRLDASGLAVGLPEGQMGNSEVGHLNIGAGRVVFQDLPRINQAIEDGTFFEKEEFLEAINHAKKNNKKLHLLGLVSDGGVHSHMDHLYALIELAKEQGLEEVYIHAILDGRDVPPQAGKGHIEDLLKRMDEIGLGKVATIAGRYYSMDRDQRWDRIKLAYDSMVEGLGEKSSHPLEAIEESYRAGITDEFMLPTNIVGNAGPVGQVEDGDSLIFFNFRPDRARQISRAFLDEDFKHFDRKKIQKLHFTGMTEYDKTIENIHVAYKKILVDQTLSQYLSYLGLKQIKIAETEKYGHITFFFNGGLEEAYPGEDRVLVDSPKVATYDLKPEMSAYQVKDQVIKRLKMDKYDFLVVNFANPDMVGHTGKIPAVIKAIETVDYCLGEIVSLMEEMEGTILITADHGNAEKLLDKDGNTLTAHTNNQVPLILFGRKDLSLIDGRLADLGPSILELMDLEKPEEMLGKSLLIHIS